MIRKKTIGLFAIVFLLFAIVLCVWGARSVLDRAFEADRPHGKLATIPVVTPATIIPVTTVLRYSSLEKTGTAMAMSLSPFLTPFFTRQPDLTRHIKYPLLTLTPTSSQSTPTPSKFAVRVIPSDWNLRFSEGMCIDLEPKDFWEKNNTASKLVTHLKSSIEIVVDNKHVENSDIYFQTLAALQGVGDENGNSIGSVGGSITACFNTAMFENGTHKASVQTTTLSGIPYTYSWDFKIDP
jgi:hypothetical protein